ncbi:unnamed protein product [Urochloa humidicola]
MIQLRKSCGVLLAFRCEPDISGVPKFSCHHHGLGLSILCRQCSFAYTDSTPRLWAMSTVTGCQGLSGTSGSTI